MEDYRNSIDIDEIGEPNASAQGIDNDAFDEVDQTQPSLERKHSIDIAPVDSRNVQPANLRKLIEKYDNDNDDNNNNNAEEPEEVKFDSEAFDAFDSEFEAKEIGTTVNELTQENITADPFASPFKIKGPAKTEDQEDDDKVNAFDSTFEPVLPKQPENTPYKVATKPLKKKKKDSFEDSSDDDDDDDSEPEENLRIVIHERKKPSAEEQYQASLGMFWNTK